MMDSAMLKKWISRSFIAFLAALYCLAIGAAEQENIKFSSKFTGRWVVDNKSLCSDPKFKDSGLFYYVDSSGKLISELRLPNKQKVQVARRSIYQSIIVIDESSLVVKTIVLAENYETKESYKTTSLIQFSDDFQTQFLLDQDMNGTYNIRDSVVLATKQKQSPFYKCD